MLIVQLENLTHQLLHVRHQDNHTWDSCLIGQCVSDKTELNKWVALESKLQVSPFLSLFRFWRDRNVSLFFFSCCFFPHAVIIRFKPIWVFTNWVYIASQVKVKILKAFKNNLNYILVWLCECVCVYSCHAHSWKPEDNSQALVLFYFLHSLGPRYWTQIIKVSGKYLYSMSHFVVPKS